ncbi:MAG: DNA polymerase IV [Thiothrix sp.]|nr:DNA polymerase IV [Thiothrix sp.]HPQ95725.1 DNA polymerase IV [Thiolinea sp.]
MTDTRKIIHIDMDCFYAAIEMRANPQLRGKPVAVGGSPNGRGVVATCSYEAREYGVHSAMPMGLALRQCPQLIVLPTRHALYRAVSHEIQAIFTEYTHLIEPLSLDEAYLDVSDPDLHRGSATLIAAEIRQRIFSSQQLTASAGVAPNKFLAKVASDWHKPDGLFVIRPRDIPDFMPTLPVKRIPGVGRVTQAHLERMGIHTCGQLQALPLPVLEREFGRFGQRLYDFARGLDQRPVSTSDIRKSLSVEDTFDTDLPTLASCLERLPGLFTALEARLERVRQHQQQHPKSLFVKLRFHDFVTTTVQTPSLQVQQALYQPLLTQAWERGRRPVRLLGIGVQFEQPGTPEQLLLNLKQR